MLPRGEADAGVDAIMRSLDEFATAKLAELERGSLRRTLVDTDPRDGIWVERNGRRLLSFSCNDYLNLTHHPAVKEAAIAALRATASAPAPRGWSPAIIRCSPSSKRGWRA